MVGSTIDYDRLSSIFVYYNRIFYSRKFVDNCRTLPSYFSTIAIDVGNYHPSLTAVRLSIIGANATVDYEAIRMSVLTHFLYTYYIYSPVAARGFYTWACNEVYISAFRAV